jgi:penicillin-binding protein 1A
MAGLAFAVGSLTADLPDHASLAQYDPALLTRVHAADGELISEYAHERRIFVPVASIPDRVKEAFISAEDRNFYQHSGLDYYGIARAAIQNIRSFAADRRPVGASTITQQVAKNFLLTNEQTLSRKLKEGILATRIESSLTKDRILELYLNEIFLGQGAYGVFAASLTYFDKALPDLSLAEAAFLAALPKAPNNYNPFTRTDAALERRNWVIDRMEENGYVTADEAAAAKAEPLGVKTRKEKPSVFSAKLFSPALKSYLQTIYADEIRNTDGITTSTASYFAEEVRRELFAKFGEDALYKGGLSVRTSLVPELQILARRKFMEGLTKFDRARGWRGPVTRIQASGDWGKALAETPRLYDVFEWRLAVILSIGKDGAQIGLQPGRDDGGRLSPTRETGRIPAAELRWAGNRSRGAKPLAAGDVVYVEPIDSSGGFALRQPPELQGAMIAMDPRSGRVVAMVGGFSFAESQFNRATQAMRQPGSSFKPFVYATAIDNGYTPSSIVPDMAVEIDQGPGMPPWRPENYTQSYLGPVTLRTGLELSRNLMTVRLARDLGMPTIAEYARRFGVYDDMLPVLSMSLGAGETTLMRMVGGYATIANGGRKVTPSLIDRVQDRRGKTIYRSEQRECPDCAEPAWNHQGEPEIIDNRPRVIDPMTAYQITSMLEGVVQHGTATVVRELVKKPIAGKTGTTNDYHDAWFIGFSSDLVVGVYLGYDQPRSLGSSSTGGVIAAPIVGEFFKVALADKPAVPFKMPPGMTTAWVSRRYGTPAGSGGGDDGGRVLEAYKPGTGPNDSVPTMVSSAPPPPPPPPSFFSGPRFFR